MRARKRPLLSSKLLASSGTRREYSKRHQIGPNQAERTDGQALTNGIDQEDEEEQQKNPLAHPHRPHRNE